MFLIDYVNLRAPTRLDSRTAACWNQGYWSRDGLISSYDLRRSCCCCSISWCECRSIRCWSRGASLRGCVASEQRQGPAGWIRRFPSRWKGHRRSERHWIRRGPGAWWSSIPWNWGRHGCRDGRSCRRRHSENNHICWLNIWNRILWWCSEDPNRRSSSCWGLGTWCISLDWHWRYVWSWRGSRSKVSRDRRRRRSRSLSY